MATVARKGGKLRMVRLNASNEAGTSSDIMSNETEKAKTASLNASILNISWPRSLCAPGSGL